MLRNRRRKQGFTLVELLVTIAIVSILVAISVPTYLQFIKNQELNVSAERVYRALEETKSNSKRDKLVWQASFRNAPHAQIVIHKKRPSDFDLNQLQWEDLDRNVIIIDGENQNETTFYQHSSGVNAGIWRTQFNKRGNTNGRLGRITLGFKDSTPGKGRPLRCVIVSTLLGTMRVEREQPKQKDSRYCY